MHIPRHIRLIITIGVLGMFCGAGLAYAQFAPEEIQPTEFQHRLTRTYVYQAPTTLAAPAEVHSSFMYSVTETSPSVQSAFIEITGVAYGVVGTGTPSLSVSIDDPALADARMQTTTLDAPANGRAFTILYDVSQYLSTQITAPHDYTFTFDVRLSNVEVGSLAAELITTYQYEAIKAGMPIRGTLSSTVFDTQSPIGAGYNALMWQGELGQGNTGRVRMQFATARCANGANNPPTCDDAAWEFRGGPLCTPTDWFEVDPNTPLDLQKTGCLPYWNDKRYYRYMIQICSDDCTVAGLYTPVVRDVIVNWSP